MTAKIDLQGSVRSDVAEKTWQRIKPLLEQFEITRIADITGLDCLGIPVAQAIRPNGFALTGSQGKGISPLLAKISAAMESIELFHAENLPKPDTAESFAVLRRQHLALDPATLERGKYWSSYHPDLPITWIKGTDLFTNQPVYVPWAYLNLNTTHNTVEMYLFSASSNGLASGNHVLEAIAHGLLEVIERDCQWRWSRMLLQSRIHRLIDNHSITTPFLKNYLLQIEQVGAVATITDITSKLGIPAYCCAISEPHNWQRNVTAMGWGCHTSKEIALSRAITEAAQSRLTAIAGSRDDILPTSYASGQDHVYQNTSRTESINTSKIPLLDFDKQPELAPTSTFEANVQQILDCLQANGFTQAVIVNHTRPEFGIPVVHAIIPGMKLGSH